ncbi:MAG TPA: hypothetical protein VLX09_20275 [Stellaceae bacterium]|nr:hypothetical protein [Stellaceae bacterium]
MSDPHRQTKGVTEGSDTAAQIVQLERDLKHYRSELGIVSDPRDRRVLVEVIAQMEARLRDLQAPRFSDRPT